MITVAVEKEYDVTTKEMSQQVYLRLYLSAFKSGLVAELKPTNFTVLLGICSYMDENGECYPTQRQLSERCGVSKTTVNKAINDLLEFKINGKPLLERKIIKEGLYKNSAYVVHPMSQVAIFGGEVDTSIEDSTNTSTDVSTDTKFKIARDVSDYYISVYRDVYGVSPNINYARELSIVKKKWLGKYTDSQIQQMIETGVREYDSRWKSPKFQRPTLSMLTGWLGEQALGLASNTDKEFEENVEMTTNSQELNNLALNRLANRLSK